MQELYHDEHPSVNPSLPLLSLSLTHRFGTACTFLGPSRKRGPPKGYIDAIEARLHQTEALLGIIISLSSSQSSSSGDERAKSLLSDLSKDPLAREIINRVDGSVYGVKGRVGKGGLDVRVESGMGGSKKAGKGQGEDSRSASPGGFGEDGIKE